MPLPGEAPRPETRIETDTMGEIEVPIDALWGASTQRAMENFQISDQRLGRSFIQVLGYFKSAAAKANQELWRLDDARKEAIEAAATEVASGQWQDQFLVDVFQTGSGTSTNMNANEIIATRANQIAKDFGKTLNIHPNDHVNMGQSSNDVFPTALNLAALLDLKLRLFPALRELQAALMEKADDFHHIVKTGRTHLMDATPIRLGQEFEGYAGLIERSISRLQTAREELMELAIGGTAVGTGVNTHPEFAAKVCHHLYQYTGFKVREASNHFTAQSTLDGPLAFSAALRGLAVSLQKIANDLRWMGSGPRAGLGELELPAVQPGSSIMPGKVNPVIPEAVIQATAQVLACDTALLQAAQGGYFELNTMLPLAAHNLLMAISLLANASEAFTTKCIKGLKATDRGPELVEQGLMLATALTPAIGYEAAAVVAKQAHKSGRTIKEVALELTNLSEEELELLLDPEKMLRPQVRKTPPPPPKVKDPFDPR